MNFNEFINSKWESFLGRMLNEARQSAEQALGMQNVSHMPILFGAHTKDPAFLSQFPTGRLHKAALRTNGQGQPVPEFNNVKIGQGQLGPDLLAHRYGDAMMEMGKHYDAHGGLPGDEADFAGPEEGFTMPLPGIARKEDLTVEKIEKFIDNDKRAAAIKSKYNAPGISAAEKAAYRNEAVHLMLAGKPYQIKFLM